MVELRSQGDATKGEAPGVLTLDYGPTLLGQPVAVSLGTGVLLEELSMVGLKAESAKEEKGRQFSCPACGAPVQVDFSSTKRLTCASCHSLIDLTQGVGAEGGGPADGAGRADHCAGAYRTTSRQALAGGGFSAPHGERSWRRRAVWLERVPALQRPAGVSVSGGL
jgi:hypothetical protein